MSRVHSGGPVFWQIIQVQQGTPFSHRAKTSEIDYPFRVSRPLVIRLPWVKRREITVRRAIVVGFWKPSGLDETEALYQALHLDPERASEQSTDFDASVEGIRTASSELGRQAGQDSGRRASGADDAGADG